MAGVPPRDFAGFYVDDAELTRVLSTLPGLNGPSTDDAAAIVAAFEPRLTALRSALAESTAFAGGSAAGEDVLLRAAAHARLSAGELELLAVIAAVELDRGRQRLLGYLQDDVRLARPTLATLNRLHLPHAGAQPEGGGAAAVGPGSRLQRGRLVDVPADGAWATRQVRLPDRVAWALNGDHSKDAGLPAGTFELPAPTARPEPTQAEPAQPELVHPEPAPLLLVCGGDPRSRLLAAQARRQGRALLVTTVPAGDGEWSAVIREATLGGLSVVLRLEQPPTALVADRIAAAGHLGWVLDSRGELPLESLPPGVRHEELLLDDETASDADWQATFGIPALGGHPLDREQLRLVAAATSADPAKVHAGVRRLAGGHLEGVAVRIRPRRGWPDLVLPDDHLRQLRELTARHRRRGLVHGDWGFPAVPSTGVVALFAGPSGTGKTLAAEVVAAELGLDLYKVDLAAVVSKYIGETEKNLERIFSAAASGDMVLFFDEADAIFGKRSEVSDANDRYANIEVAYLLQRLETYNGIVVLATNLQRNIDQAFLRRIAVALDFVPPDQRARRDIWRRCFPPPAPLGDVDLDDLAARFKVTGGMIRNIALAAAFQAADEGAELIGPQHVMHAMRREYQKLGRLLTDTEFELGTAAVQS